MRARLQKLLLDLYDVWKTVLALMLIGLATGFGVGIGLILFLSLAVPQCGAAEITIPRTAWKYQGVLTRAAHAEMGLDAPVALLAAQVHQESRWRPDAVSPVGAQGLAQFMPSTARWLPSIAPHTGEPLPYNPGWALRGLCVYDNWLLLRVDGAASACDRWAFALSAYNGGEKWRMRDQALAASKGLDSARYWGSVELVNAGRRASAFKENRGYPRAIFRIQTVYVAAGWGRGVYCD